MDSKILYRAVLGLGIVACLCGGLFLDAAVSWANNGKTGAMEAAVLAPEVDISYSSTRDYQTRHALPVPGGSKVEVRAADCMRLAPEVDISYSSSEDYKARKTQLAQDRRGAADKMAIRR